VGETHPTQVEGAMWFGSEANWIMASFFLLVVLAVYVQRIDKRSRLMKMQMDRRSIEYLKIENDLSAIQDSLLIISGHHGGDIQSTVNSIRDRRAQLLRHAIENGPNSAEILRGLEFPDIDDDPAFWADDRMKRLGLQDDEKESGLK
jgi:hypothetical protein